MPIEEVRSDSVLSLETWRNGDDEVLRPSGILDYAASLDLRVALFERLDAGHKQLTVDLSRLRLLDCAAADTLLRAQLEAQERGGALRAPGASELVLDVLEIIGAAKQLRAYDDPPPGSPPAAESDADEAGDGPPSQWTTVNELLRQAAAMDRSDPRRGALRERAIEHSLPLADRLARRFHGMGESPADLSQVAALGLMKAIDGFDPDYGTDFGGYATPTIVGELKRYFRDKGWGVHVPRRLQELRIEINRVRDTLGQRLGRSPTPRDVAEHLGVDEEQILEALVASSAYRPVSLFAPLGGDDDAGTLADVLGDDDRDIDGVEFRQAIKPLIARLPERERRILSLRFYGNRTQAQIAADLGISQMHVSRLLSRTLEGLRRALLDG
ncbi:SigB/SigF/SigG family RNA polymerase sigma factor [Dactylosporangium sp. AC04546]|uniref:SigB/SigF/SigG family RNA polymerase sigma factor n=1 Tax=Dactylosporangium sp. AC04546 TaxID=2862460 RepID=UPI001EDE27C6|nr:SigB/SigF/SigG family RNA polymerase sigma factor [Dactylosporangium sp. AC04546]WVK82695.1 SigB/SigF/SigG family RNA polymerase sigma factor [Dactylosporangium sp. AC04546]